MASCGDWNVVGWRHPMARQYDVKAVLCEKEGTRRGLAIATPRFDCDVRRDVDSFDVAIAPNIIHGTCGWRIEAVGTEAGNLSIKDIYRVEATYQPLKTLYIVDLEVAFSRFLRQ
jgi:hypothetical protein